MRFNQLKKIWSVILTLTMFQTLPLTSFASEVDKTVVSTENFTEGKANMETTPINTTIKSIDDDTTTEESPDTNETIKVETEQNPETEDINSYLVLGSDALREIVLQRYKLADNSSISSICNSFSQEELISQIHFMCPFNTATTFYQLDKFYPIEYLHIPDSDKGVGYCIYKLNEGGKLFVFFDDNPDGLYFVTNIFVVKDLLTQDDFSELQIGMTLEDVEKIDLGTKVLNSINDDYLCFCQTTHIVKDGFIQIKYTKKEDTHNSVDDHSNLIISSIEFIQNGGFIEFPNELDYDYVKGGMKYFIEAEADTDSSGGIRTIAVDFSDDNAVEITLTEGEQVQLVIPDEPDMPEISYVAFYASNQIAAVSHDLKLTGISAGEEYVTVYIGRKGMQYEEWQNLRLHILKNDSISAENRAELERLNQLDGFYRRKMELVGALNEDAPRLDMEKVQEIIDTSEDYTEILMRFNQYHGYTDVHPAGGGRTEYSYWFDPKGNESICYILEWESIYYTKTADDGTVIGVQRLYPEKTEFLPNGKYKNYEYVQYNQIKPDGYGTLNLKFIDGSTGEAFTEANGKFQLVSDDEVIKSWDASAGSEITISNLSRESTYEIRYIDDYHGDFPYDQQYRYEIDHDKGTSRFSFGYDSEVSCNVYLKKRHRGDPYLLGDVNSDNRFNVADVVTLQKWLLGKPDTVLMNWEAADLCCDGKLDVFDLCMMKRKLINNSDEKQSFISNKIFAYEKEGAGGYCTLSFNENGRFSYSPGKLSSYLSGGDWKVEGDTVILIDMDNMVIRLKIIEDALVYMAESSDPFPYMDIKDGEKYVIYQPEIPSDLLQLRSRYLEYGLGDTRVELNLTASELPEFCFVEEVNLYDEEDHLISTMSPCMDADIWSYSVDCHFTAECEKTFYTLTTIRCGATTLPNPVRSEWTVFFRNTPAP